jgi:hypothetical protein
LRERERDGERQTATENPREKDRGHFGVADEAIHQPP